MTFSVILPPGASADARVPVLYWLSGLTCTDRNFVEKAGAAQYAALHGIAIICPDTSPRSKGVPGESASWDFGVGAGFYVDATQEPWAGAGWRMWSYVTRELPAVLAAHVLELDGARCSVSGHSMGGLGALLCALKQPGRYRSVSAFAPIAHPSACPWGVKAFSGYLGADSAAWKEWDPTELVASYTERAAAAVAAGSAPAWAADPASLRLRIDQGSADDFLGAGQLLPEDFTRAAAAAGVPVDFRSAEGYDHGYFFVSSFIGEHVAMHAVALKA